MAGKTKQNKNNPYKSMAELQIKAMLLFDQPYDDRQYRSPVAPSVREVAEELGTTPLRVRKLLITAELYSTEISREVQARVQKGEPVEQIMDQMHLSRASVYSYLPYKELAYNLAERSSNAKRHTRYRKRQQAVKALFAHRNLPDAGEYLWQAVAAFAGYTFESKDGVKFRYQADLSEGQIHIEKSSRSISRETVEKGFQAVKDQDLSQAAQIRDAVYLLPMFARWGVSG